LIRDSQHGGRQCPWTLTLLHDSKVFNVNVRIRADGKFALGTFKENEQVSIQCFLFSKCARLPVALLLFTTLAL
jgi:hypothetical protein